MIDPTFRNINMLCSFIPCYDFFKCFVRYYMPIMQIKYSNGLIDIKPSFDQPVKNEHEAPEKLIKRSRNDD